MLPVPYVFNLICLSIFWGNVFLLLLIKLIELHLSYFMAKLLLNAYLVAFPPMMLFVFLDAFPLLTITKTKGDKFASSSRKCVFLGYPFGKKSGNCMILPLKNFSYLKMSNFFPFLSPEDANIVPHEMFPQCPYIH